MYPTELNTGSMIPSQALPAVLRLWPSLVKRFNRITNQRRTLRAYGTVLNLATAVRAFVQESIALSDQELRGVVKTVFARQQFARNERRVSCTKLLLIRTHKRLLLLRNHKRLILILNRKLCRFEELAGLRRERFINKLGAGKHLGEDSSPPSSSLSLLL